MLVVVIGTVLIDVITSVEAGWVWTEVIVRVVPGAVLRMGKSWSADNAKGSCQCSEELTKSQRLYFRELWSVLW